MNQEQANALVGRIEILTGRSYQASSRNYLIKELQAEPAEIVPAVVEQIEYDAPGYPPSPAEFMKTVREHASLVRERESLKERRENKSSEFFTERKYGSKHCEHSAKLVRAILTGELSREKIIEGFKAMESSYPNVGWEKSGIELKKFYDR